MWLVFFYLMFRKVQVTSKIVANHHSCQILVVLSPDVYTYVYLRHGGSCLTMEKKKKRKRTTRAPQRCEWITTWLWWAVPSLWCSSPFSATDRHHCMPSCYLPTASLSHGIKESSQNEPTLDLQAAAARRNVQNKASKEEATKTKNPCHPKEKNGLACASIVSVHCCMYLSSGFVPFWRQMSSTNQQAFLVLLVVSVLMRLSIWPSFYRQAEKEEEENSVKKKWRCHLQVRSSQDLASLGRWWWVALHASGLIRRRKSLACNRPAAFARIRKSQIAMEFWEMTKHVGNIQSCVIRRLWLARLLPWAETQRYYTGRYQLRRTMVPFITKPLEYFCDWQCGMDRYSSRTSFCTSRLLKSRDWLSSISQAIEMHSCIMNVSLWV